MHVSIGTFATKADANVALRAAGAEKDRGTWVSPDRGNVTVGEYAVEWIASNPRIRSPRTRERYESMLKHHIRPTLGEVTLAKVSPTTVRNWYTALTRSASASTAPKAYRAVASDLQHGRS